MHIIEITTLKKYFGEIKAVDDIDFSVRQGELFAFLGVNGAGKSTTINILCGTLKKDAGTVLIDGLDLDAAPQKIKERIGIVFQNSVLDERLSVKENLTVRASYYGIFGAAFTKRLEELTRLLDLKEILNRPFAKLSGGQKRKADIARGLLNRPKLLFLDEPTTGLDPQTRQTVWNTVNTLRGSTDMTVFLTTHYMEEANAANSVVILDGGKIAAMGTPNELKNDYSGDYIKLYTQRCQNIDGILTSDGLTYRYDTDRYVIKMADSVSAKEFLLRRAEIVNDFEVVKGDMDDVFLNVTGKRLRGEL